MRLGCVCAKSCRFLSCGGSASLPQQKKDSPSSPPPSSTTTTTSPPPPLFSKGTNKTVSFRPSAWLLPQLQSASVTCIIVRSQTHSPPVATTKRRIITLKSPEKPSGLLQKQRKPQLVPPPLRLMNIDERMNIRGRKKNNRGMKCATKESLIVYCTG